MKDKKTIDFRTRKLVFIDLETTGVDPEKHEIIEIAWILVDGQSFEVLSEFVAKVKPEHPETANPKALEITGYSEEEWGNAGLLKEALGKIIQLAPQGMLVGWNIYFDWSFLEKGFKKFNFVSQFDYHMIDVMVIAYSKLHSKPEIRELGLKKIATYFGIEFQEHHALEDIRATYQIFKKLMQENET